MPWTKTSAGASGGPAARTRRFVPSNERTSPRSSGGRLPSGSSASGSWRVRIRRTARRSAATPAAGTAAAVPAPQATARSVRDRFGSPTVHPRDAGAHRGDHLVADRAGPLGHFLGADLLVALPAEEDDLVAGTDQVIAAVDHQVVHGHGPGDRVAAAADQDPAPVRRRPNVPGGVADRHGGEGRPTLQPVAVAVRDGLAGREPPHHRDPGAKRHGRAEVNGALQLRPREDPVHPDAHPDQVEVGLGSGDGRSRVGGVAVPGPVAGGLQRGQDLLEPLQLFVRGRVAELLRASEVRPDAADLESQPADRLAEPDGPLRRQPHPVHPRVDLDLEGRARPRPGQTLEPVVRVAGRREPSCQGVPLRAGRRLAEHEDRVLDPRIAQTKTLLDQGHPEPGRPGLQRGPGHGHVAVAVPIGLDHRHELRGGRLQGAHVLPDRLPVDLRDGRPEPPPLSVIRRTASGRARATSPATVPSPVRSPAIRPARPWTKAPTEAASNRASPRAAMAAMAPVSTSPVPPVASTEVPLGLMRTWPSRAAINVLDPLRRVTHPVSAAALRTSPTGSSATSEAGMPNRRANSPACGVMRAPADRPARSPDRPANALIASASITSGIGDSRTSRCTNAWVSSSVDSPGPTATASNRSSS